MEQAEKLNTINYAGIFLSCFEDYSEKCIHATPEHTLVYLYSGEQVIESGDESLKIYAGECAFIRRNHQVVLYKNNRGNEVYKGISLTFNRHVLREFYSKMSKSKLGQKYPLTEQSIFKLSPRADIVSLFQSLTPYFDKNTKPTDEVIHLKLLEGMYAVLNNADIFFPILFDFRTPWKVDILEFLNKSYTDDLTIEQVACYTGRSLAAFKRDFKNISSISPQKWIIKRRLEAAYLKLKEGERVQEVYVSVGFKNPSHFSTAFKKQYGFPPNDLASG